MRYASRVYLLKKSKTTTPDALTHGERSNEYEKPFNLGTHTHEKSIEFPRFIIPQYWRGYQKINGSQERIKKKEAQLKIVTDY